MAVRIIVDSTSDIRGYEAEKLNVKVVPLNITFGNDNYSEGVDITLDEFYTRLQKDKTFPKTSQPSPNLYETLFNEAKSNDDEVLCITISSGLSGTFQAANIAKDIVEYDKIYVFDSLSCLTGLRLLVLEACKLRDKGLSANEIYLELEKLKHKVHIFAICDTLEYFYKGGRISKLTAIAGALLGIKVFVTLNKEGKIETCGHAIGMTRAFRGMQDDLNKHQVDSNYEVCYGYTTYSNNFEKLKEKTKDTFSGASLSEAQIGAVSGCHIGPGGMCYAFIEKE